MPTSPIGSRKAGPRRPPHHRPPPRHDDGFTLVELLVVLAIIAMTSVLAIASISSMGREWGVRRAARDARDLIGQERTGAMVTGVPVVIAADGAAWRIRDAGGERMRALPSGVTVAFSPPFAGAADELTLFPDGSSTGGTFRLMSGKDAIDVTTGWLDGLTHLEETTR